MTDSVHNIILTHEHTDFDALASLLGASLLFPDFLPVLPYQLNRNVGEFLALYRNQFLFLHPKELPRGQVGQVVLVDTRTANLPKGIQEQTKFQVIDHHSVDATVPDNWQLWTEAVGANTTLLVEKLMARQQELSPVESTLLALGIHEDTGSLTYAGTTLRDVEALAWLMQPARGVNLEVLSRFLQHPLSAEQRALLQTLIDQSYFTDIGGHSVVIACAEAPDYASELSTLAHRLRNFHESDALFMAVQLGDMVQVVARSTTDAIDVGVIARALGGGGHPRAAAASVHDHTPSEIREQILRLLALHGQAGTTVRQIMSIGRPQTIAPDQLIDDAAILMQRYGHEGFPVVATNADGVETLLGVITRREADRAMNHGLGNTPVQRFMQAGQVTVTPDDSVQRLRKIMIESGWGQIPVVNDTGQIIGIVTRTDLIKLWDDGPFPQQKRFALDERLRTFLAPASYAMLRVIGAEVDYMDFAVYVVGGFVRDLLLNGNPPADRLPGDNATVNAIDMDIVIEGDAIALAERVQQQYGGRVVVHRRFGTAKWLLDDKANPVNEMALHRAIAQSLADQNHNGAAVPIIVDLAALPSHFDFVTARTEFYTAPTVLPTVERGSIKLDLHRRDFTINTLALALNPDRWGELLDFYGGVNDLNNRRVRVLHSLSFVDDPTRILRAVRYEQRFDFQIGERTEELLRDAIPLLERVTAARIRHELERILDEQLPEKVLWRLHDLGVLAQLHPELVMTTWIEAQFMRLRAVLATADSDSVPVAVERLAQEPHDLLYWGLWVLHRSRATQQALNERLGLKGETQQLVAALHQIHTNEAVLTDPTVTASTAVIILDKASPLALALYIALDLIPVLTPTLERYVNHWQHIRPTLNGRDLQALGIPRGPIYGEILGAIRNALLAGQIEGRDEELNLARTIAGL